MIKISKEQGLKFLNDLQAKGLTKDDIFSALFDACGAGDAVNTRHVFFQEVIIKFNASKATAVIPNMMPYLTESHFVDVALYAYIRNGFPMKEFNEDLAKFKHKYSFVRAPQVKTEVVLANA